MAVDGWYYYKGASWGEKGTGPSPTNRSKSGTKRSIVVVDGKGVPIYQNKHRDGKSVYQAISINGGSYFVDHLINSRQVF
jgi:hypothetical protein